MSLAAYPNFVIECKLFVRIRLMWMGDDRNPTPCNILKRELTDTPFLIYAYPFEIQTAPASSYSIATDRPPKRHRSQCSLLGELEVDMIEIVERPENGSQFHWCGTRPCNAALATLREMQRW